MKLRIVCPESCAFDGDCGFVVVPTTTGELGILSSHACEISTTAEGYVRVYDAMGQDPKHVIAVESGYVQIADDTIIILVERALDMSEVKRNEVEAELSEFEEQLQNLAQDDAHRAYIYNEVAWCKLLLEAK